MVIHLETFGHGYFRDLEARHGTGPAFVPDGGRPGRGGHRAGEFPARRLDAADGAKRTFRSGKGARDRPRGA